MTSIYALCDQDGEIRYIGKSTNPRRRLKDHLRETRRTSPLYSWLRKHRDPLLLILETDCEDWQASERAWIAAAREAGTRLLNLADGGDQPFCSIEQRRANAAALNDRLATDPRARRIWEIKRALGGALRKGYVSNSTRAKLREAAAKRPDLFGEWASLLDREAAL